jgi:hypothetical protein
MTQISTKTEIASICQILQLLSCHCERVIHRNFLLCRAQPLRASGLLHSDRSQISIKLSKGTGSLAARGRYSKEGGGGLGLDMLGRGWRGGGGEGGLRPLTGAQPPADYSRNVGQKSPIV